MPSPKPFLCEPQQSEGIMAKEIGFGLIHYWFG